ncbi:MAG TPA: HNH endonuclease [Treponemataceae bacterium]|jgi:putative restriction endonuclease|nr:HNH endonuclease [Treponemataceae bacterium]
MKLFAGVTDTQWYTFLSSRHNEDINFWQPSGNLQQFRAIEPGAPFLFKLKSPYNAIGGVGFFSAHTFQPIQIAWDAFLERNGCGSFTDFRDKILTYRKKNNKPAEANPVIGCIILTNPVFFSKEDWIPVPEDWGASIVQGKTYSTDDIHGARLWNAVEQRLEKYKFYEQALLDKSAFLSNGKFGDTPRYREQVLSRVRLGQGAFRVIVTDAYNRQCAITGEHTLPVLEAAHIKPFSENGPHSVSNGILLRSDLHKLYDSGYITITTDYTLEVSRSLKEEYNNGKIYYAMHGKKLQVLPDKTECHPDKALLSWHNENIYRAG